MSSLEKLIVQLIPNTLGSMQGNRETLRVLHVDTTEHAMAIGFKIKTDPSGSERYIVKFYDPNDTTRHPPSRSGRPAETREGAVF